MPMLADPTLWPQIVASLDDANAQNRNAANAGDSLEHGALLMLLEGGARGLSTIVETHAGGGVYRVHQDSFCIGLPEESILGRHQRAAALPAAEPGHAFYSASGDQILTHLRGGGRYIAFDNNPQTSRRLQLVGAYRGRADAITVLGDFRGGPGPSLADVLRECDPASTLVVVDPLDVGDIETAMPMIDNEFPVLVFGTEPYAGQEGRERFEKLWQPEMRPGRFFQLGWHGDGRPGRHSRHAFHIFAFAGGGKVPDCLLLGILPEIECLRQCRKSWHFRHGGWTLG